MFSTTPATLRCACTAILPALTATRAASAWGVVTTSASALGIICATVRATSPVPGGMSCPIERGGEVDGDGALADPTLAAHHGDDAGLGLVSEGGGKLRGSAVERGEQVLAVFVGHHAEVDLDAPDALDHHEPVPDVRGDPVLQRATRGREGDADRDVRPFYLDTPDHVQRDEIAPDLRVPYIPQSLTDPNLGEPVGRHCSLRLAFHEFFRRLGLEMRQPTNIVRWSGLTSAKPVNHV